LYYFSYQAHYNYAILLEELNRKGEAEDQYKLAIAADPKDAAAHYNYANLLSELVRINEAEDQYLKAIEANPKLAEAHNNYAIMLKDLKRFDEAEKHNLKAIEINPNYAEAHYNYAILLYDLKRFDEAEKHNLKAIEINPNDVEAHAAYGLLLIGFDRRNKALEEIKKASDILKETERITESSLAKAWFYEIYAEKNLSRKRFPESSEDAYKAGEEYLKAAESAEGSLKDNLTLQGNVLKAKSFVRKIPKKSWYRLILSYRHGWKVNIPELIENLKNAAIYYEKASQCPAGESKDVCNACFFSISVFSETLSALSAFINSKDAEINKDNWLNSLEQAYKIYVEKNLKNGAALVDTLKQLIKCVDELAEHRKIGLDVQEEILGKYYSNLIEVSDKLDGTLKILSEHAVEAIRDYAKKQGMGFIREETKKSSNWIKAAVVTIILGVIAGLIANRLFSLDLDLKLLNLIKSLLS
jgi:Flp pilus assembly protein TadD